MSSSPRGPLSHIVDVLRLDNRQLLLETLRHDPRLGAVDDYPLAGGADSAGGGGGHGDLPPSGGGPIVASGASSSSTVEQRLVFGSADLRRVVLHQVMHQNNHRGHEGKKEKTKKGKKNKNLTQAQEEEEIMRDWNEELKPSGGGHRGTEIVGTHVLSPSGDGSIVGDTNSSSSNNNNGRSMFSQSNPFPDESDDGNNVPITSYILRGGGFDLPSLSAAALHRRNVLANSSQSSRFHRAVNNNAQPPPHGNPQPERVFRFIFVPRMTEMERAFLNELGVHGDSSDNPFGNTAAAGGGSVNSLESLPIDLIPLDDDVLSLELTGGISFLPPTATGINESDKSGGGGSSVAPPASAACMRHSEIEGCEADVADVVARSLLKLQLLNRVAAGGADGDRSSLKGAVPRVQGLGPLATAVIDRMFTLRLEEERLEAQADEEDGVEESEDEMMVASNGGDEVVNAAEGVEITTGTDWQQDKQHSGSEDPNGDLNKQQSIQALLVIDRKIDLVTPMLTPLTYEGLIDDVLGIQVGGCVSVKKSIVEPDDSEEAQQQQRSPMRPSSDHDPAVLVPLNDSDPLYTEVRDKHVETFGSFLQNQAKALKESHSQFTNRETARDLAEIHQFVKQIPVFTRNLRSLTNHIHIAELVKSAAEATSFRQRWQTERAMLESEPCHDALEDLIASGEPPYRWLRLLCLQSLTSNGIKAARYDSLRREAVQTYGYEFVAVLSDLEKAGFLRKRETFFMDSMQTPYSIMRKTLGLIVPDVDASDPGDCAYVSSGYAPATARWVQAAMRGYAGLDEAIRELPAAGGAGASSGGGGGGRWVDVEQRCPPESLVEALKRKRGPSLGTLAKKQAEESGVGKDEKKKPVLLVYFVGGVTFMELAALRFLSRRPSFPYNIVCCTTEIVNGGTLLRSLSC